MRTLILAAALTCLGLAFVVPTTEQVHFRTSSDYEITVPQKLKQRNWVSIEREGSCVHASMMVLFRWQNHPEIATMWGNKYSGGERWTGLEAKLRTEKINFASTHGKNDVEFLEWAIRTRRGSITVVTVYEPGDHMVTLVELTATRAGYLDSNDVTRVIYMPRAKFLEMWRLSGSWACTPLFAPPPKRFIRL